LAASDKVDRPPPPTLVLLAEALSGAQAKDRAVAVLRRAQQLHPDDFWINHQLAHRSPRADESVRFYTAALALRPQAPWVYVELGFTFEVNGKLPEAVDAFRRATQLQPDDGTVHFYLGNALLIQRNLPEAVDAFRRATQLQPDD